MYYSSINEGAMMIYDGYKYWSIDDMPNKKQHMEKEINYPIIKIGDIEYNILTQINIVIYGQLTTEL